MDGASPMSIALSLAEEAEAAGEAPVGAVIVENGGSLGSEATGGKVAAPIAKKVMMKAIELAKEDS